MKNLFNTNTGYFLKTQVYYFNGNAYLGYILCNGYIMFGIKGYTRISAHIDKEEATNKLNYYRNGLVVTN